MKQFKRHIQQGLLLWRLCQFKSVDIIINTVIYSAQVYLVVQIPQMIGRLIDEVQTATSLQFDPLAQRTILYIVMAIILQWALNLWGQQRVYQQTSILRQQLMTQLQKSHLQAFMQVGSEEILTRLTYDIAQFTNGILLIWTQLWNAMLLLILSLVQMLIIHQWLGWSVLLLTPLPLIVAHFLSSSTYRFAREQAQERSTLFAKENEWVTFLPLLQQYQWQQPISDQFIEQTARYYRTSFKATFISSLVNPTTRLLNGLLYTLIVALGAQAIIKGQLSLGTWVAFLSYMAQFTKPFNDLSNLWAEWLTALASGERLVVLTQMDSSSMNGTQLVVPTGTIVFNHLSFSYDGKRQVLKNITTSIPSGTHVAVIGATGSGKSTLMNLLMRFYEATEGNIYLDGQQLDTFSLVKWYEHIGYIPQEPWIFQGTVADNITFAKNDATQEEIEQAVRLSGAKAFIDHLPNGLNTMIGDGVRHLSPGQIQLLMIARMFLRQLNVLVLDEATASLDAYTEKEVQLALEQLMAGRTTFTIAHRLATVRQADIIMVMSDGEIVEIGTHQELIQKQGLYYQLQKIH